MIMRNLFAVALAAALCAACDNEPKQFVGTVSDATVNSVTVTADGRDVTFSTEGADLSEANGLLTGAPAVVDYKGKPEKVRRVLKIATDATYANAVGEWTMPDPLNEGAVMGVRLSAGGEAESINMETLKYTGWELQGDAWKILLKGQSFGNGQTLEFVEEALIARDGDGWTLAVDGGPVYAKSL